VIPRLHIVTDDEILAREDFLSSAAQVLEAGGEDVALHLRGPRTSGGVLFDLGRAVRDLALGSGSLLLMNDRIDVALVLQLPGAHLGQRSLPPTLARRVLGREAVLGLSVHGPEELPPEGSPGLLDFLVVGTIFPSASHPGEPPAGPGRIQQLGSVTSAPLLAIGGVTPPRVGEALKAGAFGVAVVGGIWQDKDPGGATRGYVEAVEQETERDR
jgi:thiamine-phosphate pyrophosphorylase